MRANEKVLAALIAILLFGASAAIAADGVWQFDLDDRGHPGLSYVENGKTVFLIGCGRAFGLHAVYSGTNKKVGDKATITIGNVKSHMDFAGEIDDRWPDDPPNTQHFLQWDLGYERQNPELFGKKWMRLKNRFLDLLDSGQELTISAQGGKYTLPPIKVPRWKTRFKAAC